ncbi:MAG: hypothetical protein PXX77_00380 [Gallionella sp.]|nr:hypothetical protein [Gallionella sp.]
MNIFFRQIVLLGLLILPVSTWGLEAEANASVTKPTTLGYWGIGFDLINFSANRNGVLSTFPSLTQNASIQSNSANLRGFVGFQFDEFLGAQFDLASMGSVRSTDLGVTKQLFNPTLFSISAVLNKPISENLKAFGKLGGTYWYLDQPSATQNTPSLNSGFAPSFGVGLDFNLYGGSERMLRLEWNYYKMDGVLLNSANSLSLNALFNF